MRFGTLLLTVLSACTGCTTAALQRHANSQSGSPVDLRYRETLENLAMVAENSFALPAYSSIFSGTAQITDTAQLVSTTAVGPGMPGEMLNPQFTRVVLGNWTLDPLNAPEKLEAVRCACRWVIYGQDWACHDCVGLLETPQRFPCPGRHFGVADRLRQLPLEWLHRGGKQDVPAQACYKAHSGDVWVWVMPEDVKALADFSLILQDIARVDINSITLQYIRPAPSDFTFPTQPRLLPCFDAGCAKGPHDGTIPANVIAEVYVDPCYKLMPDIPYYRWRIENLGSDSSLRSQINASGLH
jgi:hypothetical protein